MKKDIGGEFQYASNVRIPGLKVAYGGAALNPENLSGSVTTAAPKKGILNRLKSAVVNMVTEEASTDRPIGISKLSSKTFQASEDIAHDTFVRSGAPTLDYRFSQLIGTPRRY